MKVFVELYVDTKKSGCLIQEQPVHSSLYFHSLLTLTNLTVLHRGLYIDKMVFPDAYIFHEQSIWGSILHVGFVFCRSMDWGLDCSFGIFFFKYVI